MSNVRSVKLVPEILVSEGIVIFSSISFFIFLFFTYQKSKNLLGRDEKFATVIFRILAMIKIISIAGGVAQTTISRKIKSTESTCTIKN